MKIVRKISRIAGEDVEVQRILNGIHRGKYGERYINLLDVMKVSSDHIKYLYNTCKKDMDLVKASLYCINSGYLARGHLIDKIPFNVDACVSYYTKVGK